MRTRHHDPHAHVIHAPGKRLLCSAPLRFVRERAGGRGRRSVTASINMASFLDVMIVTVLFLLTSFSASAECPPGPSVRVPDAVHAEDMVEAPMVSVSAGTILVDGVSAGSAREIAESGQIARIAELTHLLEQKRALWLQVQPNRPFPGVCVLQIDREVPAVVVKSVFAAAVRAGYPRVSFMVKKLPRAGE